MGRPESCGECGGAVEAELTALNISTCSGCHIAAFREANPKDPVPSSREMIRRLTPSDDPPVDNDDSED